MKTRIFTLFVALFAFVWSAQADEITSLRLTLSVDGEAPFTQEFPSEGWEKLVLEEPVTSIIIRKVEVWTAGDVAQTAFTATMYSTSEGGTSNPEDWRTMPLEDKGNGKWELELGEGIDLIEAKWIGQNKKKTFEFYVQGTNSSGSQLIYNNGGANYKVAFSTGGSNDWKIKFLEESTADLVLNLDGEGIYFSFNEDGSRTPEWQLGQLSSLAIDQFALWFRYNNGVKTSDVSLQYRVYEEGQEIEGSWNRIDATQFADMGDNTMFCNTDKAGINVTNGLEPNKSYVLEVNYQIVIDGDYFFVGKGKEGSKFRFYYGDSVIPEKGIKSFKVTVNCDGEVFTESFPAKGWPQQYVKGQVSSLKILRAEVETDPSMTYLGFCSTIYDTSDGWQHDNSAWDWVAFENQGDGHWTLDWGDGREFIESDWLTESKTKTLEFFVDGGGSDGQTYKYSNGLTEQGYDNNYKVTFTTGIDPDGVHLLPASKAKGETYNFAGQRLGKDAKNYKGIVIENGKKTLRK